MKFHQYISITLLTILTLFVGAGFIASVSIDAGDSSVIITTAHAQGESYRFLAPIAGFESEIDVSSEDSFPQYVQTIITVVIGFAILAAIVMVVMAGFSYMTSTSQSGTSEAKKNIQNAVLGLILALASVVILQTINPGLVELNSVDTVTTQGDSLEDDISPDVEEGTEYGGTVHYPDERSHGDKYCMWIEAEWTGWDFIGMGTEDRYICYQSEEACEENMQDAKDAGQDAGWFDELSCDFYYQSYGAMVDTETGGEIEGTQAVGISTEGKETAQDKCVSAIGSKMGLYGDNADEEIEAFFDENPQCKTEGTEETVGNILYGDRCKAQCGEGGNPPAAVPESWDEVVWCSEEDPSASDSNCWNERSSCRSDGNQCYMHPTQIDGRDTSCNNCLFVDALTQAILDDEGGSESEIQDKVYKYEGMCSGNDAAYCRLNDMLIGKFYSLYSSYSGDTGFEITEVFPPTVEHSNECHYDGTCADVGIDEGIRDATGDAGYTTKANYLVNFIQESRAVNLQSCYEVQTAEEERLIVEKANEMGLGVEEEGDLYQYIQVIDGINANHFSVYEGESGFCDYEGNPAEGGSTGGN